MYKGKHIKPHVPCETLYDMLCMPTPGSAKAERRWWIVKALEVVITGAVIMAIIYLTGYIINGLSALLWGC